MAWVNCAKSIAVRWLSTVYAAESRRRHGSFTSTLPNNRGVVASGAGSS
jgi:hypothetical protein